MNMSPEKVANAKIRGKSDFIFVLPTISKLITLHKIGGIPL